MTGTRIDTAVDEPGARARHEAALSANRRSAGGAADAILGWRADPVAFVKACFGVEPYPHQAELLRDICKYDRIAVRSGHGSGKTTTLGWAILWWLMTRYPARVACTANKASQLEDVLWSEIRLWHGKMPVQLRNEITIQSDKVFLTAAPGISFAVARTARKENPEAFQGFHCLSDEHEILTRRGWLFRSDIVVDDEVLSPPCDGSHAEWMPVTAKHEYDFAGRLNIYDGKSISFAVTDGHRFPTKYDTTVKHWKLKPYSELASRFMVRRHAGWTGMEIEVPAPFAKYGWSAERFAAFVGFWIGDGGVRQHTATGRFYETILYQGKAPGKEYIRGYLFEGMRYSEVGDEFVLSDRAVAQWLMENVGRYGRDRSIPRFLLDAPIGTLERLVEGLWAAEGSIRKDGGRGQFYNTSLPLMDGLQEVLIKLGRTPSIGINTRKGAAQVANGRNFEAQRHCYVLTWVDKPTDPQIVKADVSKGFYAGKVWCISTPHQTFYTRRNGRVFISGNSEHMLFIAEEASGIDDVIFQVGEGAMSTPGAKTILAGNPTRSSGYFFDAFHKMQGRWRRHHWDCEVISREFPKQVAPQFIEDMARKHGTESNVYRFRVKGDFPKTEDDAVIPLGWIEDAQRRDVEPAPGYLPVWGLDVARFGDDRTALAKRCHNVLMEPLRYWHGKDTMQVSGLVLHEYEAAKKAGMEPHEILVDVIGIGAGVVDRMRELGLPVRGVNVSESASVKQNYLRLRDELWWRAREWFEQRDCRLPPVNDDVKDGTDAMEILVSELSQPKYTATSGGKILIETKDDMKKRGLLSPDLADAFCLTFAGGYAKADQHDRYSPKGRYDQVRSTSWMAA